MVIDNLTIQYKIVKWDEDNQELINWHRDNSIKLLGESVMKYLLDHPEGIREVVVKERSEIERFHDNTKFLTRYTITVYFWRDEIK